MKTYKYIAIGLISVLSAISTSCSSDYLNVDVSDYTQKERLDEIQSTYEDRTDLIVTASLKGSYEMLRAYNLGGNSAHDYFGLKSIHLATDLMTADMVQDVHHHFGWDYGVDNNGAGYRRTNTTWRLFYSLISNSNIVLRDFFQEKNENPNILALKAEVLALRGIAYYHLINLYQKTYKGHESMPGVPIILSTEDQNMPRETVEKVYKQILEDLEFAIKHGKITRENKEDADKLVAAAYAAKTYAAMERWDDVIRCATIATEGLQLHSPSSSWVTTDSEWIWGVAINSQTATLYASLYSHLDNTIGGYAGGLGVTKSIHNHLYNKIPDSDSRKKLFINKEKFSTIAEIYPNLNNYANIKFITPSNFTGDYCYLRVTDPYLLLIEAYVEKGDLGNASATFNNFIAQRDGEFDQTRLNSKETWREEVRFQRAIELWGEGTAFFDMKRWKTGLDRTAPETNHRIKEKRRADSNKFEYQIPQKEMETNTNISVQNPMNDPEDA